MASDCHRLLTITHKLVEDLQHGSIRAQAYGYDRKLAEYIGIDFDALLAADWDAALVEQFARYSVLRLDCGGYSVADFWPGSC